MTNIKLLFIIITVFSGIFIFFFLDYLKNRDSIQFKKSYKNYQIVQPLNATTGFYKKSAQSIYHLFVNKEDVLSIIKKASQTDDLEIQNNERQKLFNKLSDEYEVFKQRGIKQLHFHFKDSTSFLRFHKPSKFGDDLSNIRYSLVLVNENKEFVEGFEEGRIFNGYRYVFPLIYHDEHIGSVEVSIGFNAIAQILHEYFSLQPYMILKDTVVKEKVFSKERRNYEESFISSKYYHEVNKYDNITKLNFNKEVISKETIEDILEKYRNQFNKRLEKNQYFQFFENHNKFSYIISFYPIKNIKSKNIGYIVLMEKNYDYIKIEDNFLYRLIFLYVFLLIVIGFIFNLKRLNISLRKSEKKAQQAAKAKSEFLANMSHEIRTPLNAIFGFLNLLQKMEHPPKVKKYLNTILSSSETLLSVINDILDFSKIESGKLTCEMTSFEIKKVVEDIYMMFSPLASEKNISLNLDYNLDSEPYIRTDITRVKQVVTNLLSNAIKFTPNDGEVKLIVQCIESRLLIQVKDTGIGIAKEKQDDVFIKFQQADNSTTRKYGGTGLGLTISYYITECLGGKLYLKSELGRGSTFYFDIPVEVVDDIKEDNYIENTTLQYDGHILLVEDNKTNQMMMQIILADLGITLELANDGFEAIEAYKNGVYDLILMDENMPNMNGIEATRQILKLQENSANQTPIIALTADAVNNPQERYLSVGMKDYLAKPLDEKELLRVLNIYLKQK